MPLCPTQVAQCDHSDVLPILEPIVAMMLQIIQRSCSLEMMQSIGEFPLPHVSGAKEPMGNTQGPRIIMSFGLGVELCGCILLPNDVATNMVTCPYPVEDREFLRGISCIVNEFPRP